MFFISTLKHTLFLSPSRLNNSIYTEIRNMLYSGLEGTCTSDRGYIIAIISIDIINTPKITNDGYIQVPINYTALVLKPLKGEVMDANVSEINKLGIIASIGPMNIFISNYHIPTVVNIEKDMPIRLKIIGTNIGTRKVYAIGTINEDSLGIIY